MPRRLSRSSKFACVSVAIAASLAMMFAVGATAPTANASVASRYEGRVGLSSHLAWMAHARARAELKRLREGGVRWVREDFLWSAIEPTRGSFKWGHHDSLMKAAARSRVNVLAVLAYSPRWASSDPSGRGSAVYPPKNVDDYASFASAVVRRYGRGGDFWKARPELPRRPLAALELWNEPAGFWNWRPNPDPAAYARLCLAAVTKIRKAEPTIRVLAAGDVVQTRADASLVAWLANVITASPRLPKLIDGYSIHPYPHPFTKGPYDDLSPGYFWDYRSVAVAREVASARKAARPFWITEVGWSTATSAPGGVSEEVQAQHVRGAVQRAIEQWGAFVKRVFIYSWDRSNGNMADREGNFGILRADGSPKPAWGALVDLLDEDRRKGMEGLWRAGTRVGGP